MDKFNTKIYFTIVICLLFVVCVTTSCVKKYKDNGKESENSLVTGEVTEEKAVEIQNKVKKNNGEKAGLSHIFGENDKKEPVKDKAEKGGETPYGFAEIVSDSMKNVPGRYQWGYCVFPEGEKYIESSYAAPSASVIKVFIMEYVFNLIEKGELTIDATIEGRIVKNLIYDMITWSDNDSTNVFINHFGMADMNSFFAEMGYADTRLERKMLDTAAQSAGRENYTSVNDTMQFLTKLYNNRNVKPYSDMLDIMKKQQVSTKIRRKFGSNVVIANKTGELSNVENDIGIIFGEKGDVVVSFMCSSLSDTSAARNAISKAAYELAEKAVFE